MQTVDAESHYLWDNWTCFFRRDGLLHRFSLTAPRTLAPDERHDHVRVHHWTSRDAADWRHRGRALGPGPPGSFDDQAIWSGCAVDCGERLALFYTGVRAGSEKRQSIAVAFFGDGRRFEKTRRPVLEPRAHPLYETGGDDDVVMAWRDPHVFAHPATGAWHMLFAARRPGPEPRGVVGHAVARDDSLLDWRLLPPLELPASYTQMETPALVFHDGAFYCFASTKDRAVEDEAEANQALRAWRAPTLEGPWEPAGRGGTDLVLDAAARIFAVSFVAWRRRHYATGFYTGSHPRAYSWVPLLGVEWAGCSPRLSAG